MKILILIVIIVGAFIYIYKNIDKIKATYEVVREKTKAINKSNYPNYKNKSYECFFKH